MPNPFGDLGQALITFEETIKKLQKGPSQLIDGYVEESPDGEITFRGVIVPNMYVNEIQRGLDIKGDSILYVRITQVDLPELAIEDVVIDSRDQKWRITDEADFTEHGKVRLFGIVKLTC